MIHYRLIRRLKWIRSVCRMFCMAVFSISCLVLNSGYASEVESVSRLVEILSSEKSSLQDKWKAEDRLNELPSEQVLPDVFQAIKRPKGGRKDLAGRENDVNLPPEWQSYYAMKRIWNYHAQQPFSKTLADWIIQELRDSLSDERKELILEALERQWLDGAEAPLVGFLRNEKEDFEVSLRSAHVLLCEFGTKYHEDIVRFVEAQSKETDPGVYFYYLLKRPPFYKQTGVNKEVVRLGFQIMIKAHQASPYDDKPVLLLQIHLGNLLNQKFKTVDDGLKWWEENKARYGEVE